jgi:rubrerythrin
MIIKISITKTFLALILFNIVSINISAQQSSVQKIQYVCTPCGIKCDEEVFDAPGKCPICEMEQ